MAQPWAMRLPLIDGHGNFGSLDDGPAAMRYTECRMAPAAAAMTDGLDEDTVDFKPNYDGKDVEPTVLPAAFPNLLVNGATGIAVGMATNCPPHNLVEVVQALRHLIKQPDAGIDELMRFIPGPDLPSGGKIIGLDGIRDAYHTGKGSFRMRATARIEQVHPRRKGIVITELPYLIGPERVIEQIKSLVNARRLQGVADVKDLSDRANGTRLVIEIKSGFNPDAILEQLYKLTKIEDNYAINAVALVDGQPRTLTLRDLLTVYLEHRYEVTRRRTEFARSKAQERLHLVQGLLVAILDIDDVIAIIRTSDDTAHARSRLMEVFELSETQTNYILEMPLRRLTRFSRIELETERGKLEATIAELTEILENPDQLRALVGNQLAEIAQQHGTPRRTILLAASGVATTAAAAPLEVADDPCWVLLSSAGLLARTNHAQPLPPVGARANHDVIVSKIISTARGDCGVITSTGRLIKISTLDLPTVPITAHAPNLQGGTHVTELITLDPGEKILCLTTLAEDSLGLALGTAFGVVKRVNPEILGKESWDVIRLEAGDRVVGAAELTSTQAELVFLTNDAQLLHFPASAVRPQGRSGGGMAGIKLGVGASVVYFGAITATDAVVVTVSGSSRALPGTDAGSVKATGLEHYPAKGRATGGVRCHRFLKGEDSLLLGWVGQAPAIAAAASGSPVPLPAVDARRDGSGIPGTQPIAAIGSAGGN
jgi:DNA gyrase subunit A